MKKLHEEKLLINLKKCFFMKKELIYLGFVISQEGLKMDPEKVKAILDWPSPRNVFYVRSFHGLEIFYRKFIRNFSGICAPILDTVKKERQPFKYTIVAEKEFKLLKDNIIENPILVLSYFSKFFYVKCDASGSAIGGVSSQDDKPVAYFSEKMNEAKLTKNSMQ